MTKTWLITGTAGGVGRELAEAVLADGDQLVATARDTAQIADLVARYPEQAVAVPLDPSDRRQAIAAVRAAIDAFGRIDVVVNDAGSAGTGPVEAFTEDEYLARMEADLLGVINVNRAALPILREQRFGQVIQISSVDSGTPFSLAGDHGALRSLLGNDFARAAAKPVVLA
jgi:NAD(P)-dependent dehydrogenase (short-subunit alcohol dehydrogenase family)